MQQQNEKYAPDLQVIFPYTFHTSGSSTSVSQPNKPKRFELTLTFKCLGFYFPSLIYRIATHNHLSKKALMCAHLNIHTSACCMCQLQLKLDARNFSSMKLHVNLFFSRKIERGIRICTYSTSISRYICKQSISCKWKCSAFSVYVHICNTELMFDKSSECIFFRSFFFWLLNFGSIFVYG